MALAKTPYFEDVAVGLELPGLEKGPLTTAHLMRWSAAMTNPLRSNTTNCPAC